MNHCRKHIGDNATILYDYDLWSSMMKIAKEQGKETGGPWDCYHVGDFFGWESDRLVVVTDGGEMMELITRARTHLSVFLMGGSNYAKTKKYFQQAAKLGLIEMVQLGEDAVGF